MDKQSELRNKLFESYFQVESGIFLEDLMKNTTFIVACWKDLHHILEQHVKYFDTCSSLSEIKKMNYHEKDYLIIKIRIWDYLVIDLENNQVVEKKNAKKLFTEDFFIHNFNEKKFENRDCFNMYHFEGYDGDITEVINYYQLNQEILTLPTRIYYKIGDNKAWTYLSIDLANGTAQLGFQTPEQFLYEQLFLHSDLTPSRMQDAISKIGVDKMKEMFQRIKDIQLPEEVIPDIFYEKNMILPKNDGNMILTKKKKNGK